MPIAWKTRWTASPSRDSGSETTSARQYYFCFGLFPLNTIDTQRMAKDLTSYTIETGFSVTDFVLSLRPDYKVGLRHHTPVRWDSCLYFY